MKTLVLVALSVSLVACGGSLEAEGTSSLRDEAALGFVAPPALSKSSREPSRVEGVVRAVDAIEAARLAGAGVVELKAETIEAVRGTEATERGDVIVLSVAVVESARESLLINASRPVSAETMLAMTGVTKVNLSCKAQSLGETSSSAHCTWADGRALSATELRALPELLSFVGSLED